MNTSTRTVFKKATHLLVVMTVIGIISGIRPAMTAYAAAFTVTKTADTNDGMCDADCSLREAIIAANALAGDDTIILPSGIYTLTIPGASEDVTATGDLDITDNLTIMGASASGTIIDGNGSVINDRVLDIKSAAVQISGMTIQNGYPATGNKNGGGILTIGTLTLTDIVIKGNIGGNGGGILNTGTLMITASTLIGNTATTNGGGGIYNLGVLTVNNSTISGNTASTIGFFGGGGILADLYSTSTTIVNSTISGNTTDADGGGLYINSAPSVNLNNVTITNNTADSDTNESGNGGGIAGSTLNFRNTIIAGNFDNSSTTIYLDCSGTKNSQGYDLIQDITGCTIGGDTMGNIIGIDPNLGLLQNNGGTTLTHALLPGSPAIAAGNPATPGSGGNACEANDQRNIPRLQGPCCDIGAYEFEGAQTIVSPSASNTLTYTDANSNTADVFVPTGAVTQTIALVYMPVTTTASMPPGFAFAGWAFTLDAYLNGALLPGFSFEQPVTVMLIYNDATLSGVSENTLVLDYWNGNAWVDAATTCTPTSTYIRQPDQDLLGLAICHLSQFGLFGQHQVYLPLSLRN